MAVEEKVATVGADGSGNTEEKVNADVKNQPGQTTEGQESKTDKEELLTLTKDELEKRLQSEADKRVKQAEQTFEKRFEKELREKLDQEREDAERLAKLTAGEREKELLERTKSTLDEKEKKLRQREMKLAAIDVLNDEGLPVSFADQLLGESVDETHERIQKFKKAWHDAIDGEVNKRLKGRVPESGGTKTEEMDMNRIIRKGFERKI